MYIYTYIDVYINIAHEHIVCTRLNLYLCIDLHSIINNVYVYICIYFSYKYIYACICIDIYIYIMHTILTYTHLSQFIHQAATADLCATRLHERTISNYHDLRKKAAEKEESMRYTYK
jgi:hypothetical protein